MQVNHMLERFAVTKGGEYMFLPSLTALRWLTDVAARYGIRFWVGA